MGGPGSGRRWRGTSSPTTDNYVGLDVRYCESNGMLRPGFVGAYRWLRGGKVIAEVGIRAFAEQVVLTHRTRVGQGEWKDHRYAVQVVRTPCNYGRSRPWFLCPRIGCGRRVAILYGAETFACRRCFGLSFASPLESESDRFARRADAIRARLGWEPGILNGYGDKPRGMHLRTFRRLCELHDRLIGKSVDALRTARSTQSSPMSNDD